MSNQSGESAAASIWIDASPQVVWRSVANIANLARYSPETIRTEWLPGSDRHEVGARFRGHNSNDRHDWHTDCEITEFTGPASFAFVVAPDEDGRFGTRWHYTLASDNAGTRLTESFESPILVAPPSEMDPNRRRVLVDMLDSTLARLKDDIEAGDPVGLK